MDKTRLSAAAEAEAKGTFADHVFNGREVPEGYIEGLRIAYREGDDGRTYYQIDDASGRGDGTGEWHQVEGRDHDHDDTRRRRRVCGH